MTQKDRKKIERVTKMDKKKLASWLLTFPIFEQFTTILFMQLGHLIKVKTCFTNLIRVTSGFKCYVFPTAKMVPEF